MVNLEGIPEAKLGDEVVLIGRRVKNRLARK
jgi:alanine racemase